MNLWFRNTGNTAWTTASNWSTTADLATPAAAVPTASDAVFFIAGSGNCNIASVGSALTLDFTGYSGTLSGTSGINVSGNVTLSATMTITMTGVLTINATATLKANGKILQGTLQFNVSATTVFTLIDDWQTVGLLNIAGAGAKTFNGNNIYCASLTVASVGISGTTGIVFNGTGTWSGNFSIANNITINTAGTLTVSGSVSFGTGTLKYIAGTVVTTGSTLFLSSSCSIDTNTLLWNIVSLSATTTPVFTLLSNLNLSGSLTMQGATGKTLNGFTAFIGGLNVGANTLQGTTNLVFNGTGTWTGANAVANNITINTTGTITVSGSVVSTLNFTYIAGTVVTTGSTLTIGGNAITTSFDSNGIIWNNVTFAGTNATFTLNSDIIVGGTLSTGGTGTHTVNGAFNIRARGGFTGTQTLSGTATLLFEGTGTYSVAAAVSNPIVINTTGAITFNAATNTPNINNTFTHIAGTVITTGSTMNVGVNTVLNCPNIIWNNIQYAMGVAATFNLVADIHLSGTLTVSNTGAKTFNGFTIYTGGLTSSANTSGTTNLVFNGTGTWSGGSVVGMPITINTAGTLTLSGSPTISNSLKYIAGTLVVTGSTLNLLNTAATVILDSGGATWNSISVGTGTSVNFVSGFTTATLIEQATSSNSIMTFNPAFTYYITGSISTPNANPQTGTKTFQSSVAGTKAHIVLSAAATCMVACFSFQDIDATGGRAINVFKSPSVVNCVNVNSYIDPFNTYAKHIAA